MAIVIKTRTYTTGDNLTAAYYNADRDEIIAGVNSIVNAQIDAGAAISESKIQFSGSGHAHGGGTDGEKIVLKTGMDYTGLPAGEFLKVAPGGTSLETATVPITFNEHRAFGFYVAEDPVTVANDKSWNPAVTKNVTAQSLYVYAKTGPVGSSLTVSVRTTGGTTIATVSIPSGSNSANTSTMVTPSIALGTYLRLDVDAVGSGTPGSYVSAVLETVEA